MKKILLSAILLLNVLAANAQKTSIGITGGIGTAWVSGIEQDVTINPVWNAGLTLVHSTANHLGFGADLKYSREGVRYTSKGAGPTLTTKIASDYIRVPLRSIYFLSTSDQSIRPNVSFGPTFGFLVGSETRIYDSNDNLLITSNSTDALESFDLGIQGTIGASFMLSSGTWLSADIAYNHGLLKQNKSGTNDMLNRNLALNLGLRFGIGK